jgi:tRNA dimethylallyltransferase
MSQPKIIIVMGPTAAGKSTLAMRLAHEQRGAIINADAMQIYGGLPILSAQPSPDDQQKIPHYLYGIVDPAVASSAGKWVELAKAAIQVVIASEQTPILVGGTGLYIRSLSQGIADIPDIPVDARAQSNDLYEALGEAGFRKKLAKHDSETAARLAKNDRQRLVRAYEVFLHTGKPISEWQKNTQTAFLDDFVVEAHLVMPPRDELYEKCDKRFLEMLKSGAESEVQEFNKRNIPPALPASKTIGVRELTSYFEGKISREEAIKQSQQATRNYAKRQMTWFRNQKLIFKNPAS